MTDVENISAHKMRLTQKDLGVLVRVDELSEEQLTELFEGLQEEEDSGAEAVNGAGRKDAQMQVQSGAQDTVEARKLIITDLQERIKALQNRKRSS